jgi:hypothetical protein
MAKLPWYCKVIKNPKLNKGISISNYDGSLWVIIEINKLWICLQRIKALFNFIKQKIWQ